MNKPEKKTFDPTYDILEVLEYIRRKYKINYTHFDRYKRDLLDGISGNGCFHYVNIGEDINPDIIETFILDEFGPIERVWVEW